MAARTQPVDSDTGELTAEQLAAVEVARAQVAAGLTIAEGDVDAWIDSWDTDAELPIPQPIAKAR